MVKLYDQTFFAPHKQLITVYGYDACQYSLNSVSLLHELELKSKKSLSKIYIINDKHTNKKKQILHNFLLEKTDNPKNYTTYPRVFYRGKFMGGYEELAEMINNLI